MTPPQVEPQVVEVRECRSWKRRRAEVVEVREKTVRVSLYGNRSVSWFVRTATWLSWPLVQPQTQRDSPQ